MFADAAQVAIHRDKRAPNRPALFAPLPGIAVNLVPAGHHCASRTILRAGVAWLGMRITLGQLQSLGIVPLLLAGLGLA